MKYIYALFLLFCAASYADNLPSSNKDSCVHSCVKQSQWKFSMAFGLGTITNPVTTSPNIPLVIIPYVNYYGENWFIQNNVLGYTFKETQTWSFSFISQLNREKAFFSNWKPQHLLLPNVSFSSELEQDGPREPVAINHITHRNWAIDGGLQINGFFENNTSIELQWLQDISSVYNGNNVSFSVNKLHIVGPSNKLTLGIGAGFYWLSPELVNYYYGIKPKQKENMQLSYHASDSLNGFARVSVSYQLSHRWQFKLNFKREFLGSSIKNSPIINSSSVDIAYVGLVYAF